MPAFNKLTLAAAATTGNNTGAAVQLTDPESSGQIGIEFVVEVAGATPTVTFALQGSFDGTNFDTTGVSIIPSASDTAIASKALTAVGTYHYHVSLANSRAWRYFRLVTTSNTNVTYSASLYPLSISQ